MLCVVTCYDLASAHVEDLILSSLIDAFEDDKVNSRIWPTLIPDSLLIRAAGATKVLVADHPVALSGLVLQAHCTSHS